MLFGPTLSRLLLGRHHLNQSAENFSISTDDYCIDNQVSEDESKYYYIHYGYQLCVVILL